MLFKTHPCLTDCVFVWQNASATNLPCTYVVGIDGYSVVPATAVRKYSLLFNTYLNTQLFDTGLVPCNFSMTVYTAFEDIRTAVKNRSIQFFFGDSVLFSCFQVMTCMRQYQKP